MPSGVATRRVVSSMLPAARSLGFHHDGVGDIVMNAAPSVAEHEQHVDQAQQAHEGHVISEAAENPLGQPAQEDQASDSSFASVGAHHAYLQDALADRGAVALHHPQIDPPDDRESDDQEN